MNLKKMKKRINKLYDFYSLRYLQKLIEYIEKQILAAREYIIKPQTVFSDHLIQRLLTEPITEIFKDCSIYFYGYENESYMECVLAKNLHAGGYPFANVSAKAIANGIYTRVEIVSNTDLFSYISADVGDNPDYPIVMSNVYAVIQSTVCIANISIKF